jgi:Tol biopolymer transport system component
MTIRSGMRLGPYEIVSPLGAGGMGEVYKARDTRLDRVVAVKVLSPQMAARPEARERFEREARTIASLNHPHICTLHDIGHQDGIHYLVMEYLEGQTLAARLLKGPLPTEQVLRFAVEIADALDKAHRKGVTHRDIKPGNIMLTQHGTKLLDFGLAKLKQEAVSPAIPSSQLPTMSHNPTAEGAVIGTLQYMAPEQIEGKNDQIDARTDIFEFGATIYEMATGKKAFQGSTNASIMAKILESDPPPMASIQPITPPALDHLVGRCLAKQPDERWQAAGDLRLQLEWISEGWSQTDSANASSANTTGARRHAQFAGFGAVAGALVVAIAGWLLRPPAVPKPVLRLTIALPPGQQLAGTLYGSPVALSPDGTRLVYVGRENGTQQLYLRPLDSRTASPITGTAGAVTPRFSPDGQRLLFFADGKLKKISLNGGAALPLADSVLPAGSSWSSEGIVGFGFFRGPLLQVPADGGATKPLTQAGPNGQGQYSPEFLPGGKAILSVSDQNTGSATKHMISVQVLPSGGRREVIAGVQPRYAGSGHLIYAQGETLMAVPFDAHRLEITGSPVPVAENVAESPTFAASQYSISDNGSLAYISGGAQNTQRKLVWVSRNGSEQPVAAPPKAYQLLQLSPDGKRIAVELDQQIWIYDLARETLSRFTLEGDLNRMPVWTPDGRRVAFYSDKETTEYNLWWQAADGSGGLERLTTDTYANNPRSYSPDGRLLAFVEINPKTRQDIWTLRTSDHQKQPFLATPFAEIAPTFSPDGHWLAYVSNESGRPEVYVQAFPGPGGKWQISTDGGTDPTWNRNGRELFFRSGNKMLSVDVKIQAGFTAGKPRVLFEGSYVTSDFPSSGSSYDVSPDGQQFLMIKPAEQSSSETQINIVMNWFEELNRLTPVK